MQPDAVMLSDVTITSSVAVARKTPVAVSTVDPVFIEEKLGSQEFPEILKSTPGVYTTKMVVVMVMRRLVSAVSPARMWP